MAIQEQPQQLKGKKMKSFAQSIQIRWSDLDINGHVRHSAYYDYGAQIRTAYLQNQGVGIEWMKNNGIGPVLLREEAKFFREIKSGDELVIDVRLSGLSDDHRKWSMHHRILRGDKLCATIDLDGAWLNLKTRRIAPPPTELLEKFAALERTEDFRIIVSGRRSQ
jgi:acyl-CoA thioester hydrolase